MVENIVEVFCHICDTFVAVVDERDSDLEWTCNFCKVELMVGSD